MRKAAVSVAIPLGSSVVQTQGSSTVRVVGSASEVALRSLSFLPDSRVSAIKPRAREAVDDAVVLVVRCESACARTQVR